MDRAAEERIGQTYHQLTREFDHWEKTKDLVDQLLDVTLNYRQSDREADFRANPGIELLGRTSFECSARHPGMVCIIGSEAGLGALLGSESRCAVGHLLVPTGPEDELSVWRQAWRTSRHVSLGGVW